MRRLAIPAGAAAGLVLGIALACGEVGWRHWRADRRKLAEQQQAIHATGYPTYHSLGAAYIPPEWQSPYDLDSLHYAALATAAAGGKADPTGDHPEEQTQ